MESTKTIFPALLFYSLCCCRKEFEESWAIRRQTLRLNLTLISPTYANKEMSKYSSQNLVLLRIKNTQS